MADEDGYPTNEDTVALYNLVNSGQAFQNPVAGPIAALKAVIADQLPKFTALEAIIDPNGVPNWFQADFTSLIAALGILDTALDDFLTHTNRTSGVSFPGDISGVNPSFLALIAVSATLQEIESAIGGGTTDTVTDFFDSLSSYPPILEEWTEFLTDLDLKIQIIDPYDPPDYPDQPLPFDTISEIQSWAPQLDTTRSTENGNYNSGISTIIKWALAGQLVQPSGVWRDFVHDVVGTPALQEILPEPLEFE